MVCQRFRFLVDTSLDFNAQNTTFRQHCLKIRKIRYNIATTREGEISLSVVNHDKMYLSTALIVKD